MSLSPSTPRVRFDGLLGTLGVSVIRADCHSSDHHDLASAVSFFFDTGVSRSHRTLLTLCLSPLLSQHLLSSSSSHRLFYPIRRPACIRVTWLSHNPHVHALILTDHISITPVGLLFSHPRRFARHSVHNQKTLRVSFSHTQVIQSLSFSLVPTIFIHSGS